jgi:hypothetical protein
MHSSFHTVMKASVPLLRQATTTEACSHSPCSSIQVQVWDCPPHKSVDCGSRPAEVKTWTSPE